MALTVTLAFTAGVMGDLPPGVSGGFDPPSAFELCNIDTGRSASNCPRRLLVFGRGGLNLDSSFSRAQWAPETDRYNVSFCSNTPLPHFLAPPGFNFTVPGVGSVNCPVYAERDANGTCVHGSTYAEATARANAFGARVCSAAELVTGCGRSTGCDHDHRMLWSSTLDPHCDPTDPCAGVPTPAPSAPPTVIAPPPTSPSDCSAYRVQDGSWTANLRGDAAVETRHELTCCADEAVGDWRQCGGTPSTHGNVWASRDGNLFLAARAALAYGTQTYRGLGNTSADGGAMLWENSGCVHNVDWLTAAQICNAIVVNPTTDRRARLCTVAELTSHGVNDTAEGCGVDQGCLHNTDAIWSSDPASNVSGCTVPPIAWSMQAQPTPGPTLIPTATPSSVAPTYAPVTLSPTVRPTAAPSPAGPTPAGSNNAAESDGGSSNGVSMVVYYAAGAGLAVILLVVLVTRSKSQEEEIQTVPLNDFESETGDSAGSYSANGSVLSSPASSRNPSQPSSRTNSDDSY